MRLDPGERLGEWVIVALLARGGQGAVLRARHARTGAQAALKVLLDPAGAAARRFAQEARVLERAAHPHVVRALERGEAPGVAWLALELVEGEDLLAVVRRGVPPFDATARALSSVALALERCHLLGIVHRDLKPGNVLVERATGRAVLVDFGLVKRDAAAMHLSSLDGDGEVLSLAGEHKGTPEYMAPEQVSARLGEVGPATDVWGLGATLFHLLTGEAPFGRGAAPIVMRKITRQAARDPRALNPQVPAPLAALTLRCLAKDPAARPRALEVASALAAFSGLRVEAPRPAPARPPASSSGARAGQPASDSAQPPARGPLLPRRLPAPGETFAGCRIARLLGRGAFGAVFEAARPDGTSCALKVFHALDAADVRARFLREAEAGRAIDHAGVVRSLAHGEERGLLWLAMELVPGARTLDEYVTQGGVPLATRVRLLVDVARAVDAAHRVGIVHRDLKPQNVLVAADGRPMVVDLGLARHLDKERLTLSGAFLGTVHYMAPEQVLGRVDAVGPGADVWALGVMLHELIAGARPFGGDTLIEVMAGILEDTAPDPCARVPEAPAALGDVCRRALARDPAGRYASAADFADAAAAALLSRRGRRSPRRALAALALGLALLVGGGAVALGLRRAAARRAEVVALGEEALDLLRGEGPLSAAADRARALRARVEELTGEAAAGATADTGETTPRRAAAEAARALDGLVALAAGDLQAARDVAGALVDPRAPAALALRGGLLALGGEEPLRAAQDLARAMEGGVARTDLRTWRARALVARGPSARDAPLVLDDLAAVARARDLSADEVAWRARALLALDRADEAAQALAGRDDVSAEVRWRVALARAAPVVEVAPARALAALEGLSGPPPDALADDAQRLGGRAARALEAQGRAGEFALLAPLAALCVALGAPTPSPPMLEELTRRATTPSPDPSTARIDLQAALAALAPDQLMVQREVGRSVQYVRSQFNKRRLLLALRRALALASPGDDERAVDEVLLCVQLGAVVWSDAGAGHEAPEARECLELAERLMASGRLDAPARCTVLGARGVARWSQGDAKGAVADLDAAGAAGYVDLHVLWRGRALLDAGRADEGLETLAAYVTSQREGHIDADGAARAVWDLGRSTRHLDLVRRVMELQTRLRPERGVWWVRLAWAQRATGGFADVSPSLTRAAGALEEDADEGLRALAARARSLARGSVPGRELDDLLAALDRR